MKIPWEQHSFHECTIIIDDVVGLAFHFVDFNFKIPIDDFPGEGFLYSLFITWQKATGNNRHQLFPIMKHCIDEYDIATKLQNIRTNDVEAQRMSNDFLKNNGVIKFES